eukprot:5280364-Prymnesium_polylepis.1
MAVLWTPRGLRERPHTGRLRRARRAAPHTSKTCSASRSRACSKSAPTSRPLLSAESGSCRASAVCSSAHAAGRLADATHAARSSSWSTMPPPPAFRARHAATR